MNNIPITLPEENHKLISLKAGDMISLSGIIYTARDAAHEKLCNMIEAKEALPIEIEGITVYYCGPCPAKPNQAIGSAGPTTSGRMDSYTPALLELGLKAMIGKGERSPEVIDAVKKHKAVYLGAIGGTGALIADCIKSSETVAFEELGCEAIRKLYVKDMPLIVLIDSEGDDFYANLRK